MLCDRCGQNNAVCKVIGYIISNGELNLFNFVVENYPFDSLLCNECFHNVSSGQMSIHNRKYAVFVRGIQNPSL